MIKIIYSAVGLIKNNTQIDLFAETEIFRNGEVK